MKKVIKVIGLFLWLALAGSLLVWAQEAQPLKLTLEDCILRTMQNNLGVTIQKLSPEISQQPCRNQKKNFIQPCSLVIRGGVIRILPILAWKRWRVIRLIIMTSTARYLSLFLSAEL